MLVVDEASSWRAHGADAVWPGVAGWSSLDQSRAIAAGILGRGLLGRPWVVRATPREDPANALTWKVIGLRRSARVIDEVSSALAGGLDPSPSDAADLIRPAP
jgi:hypothetical protein